MPIFFVCIWLILSLSANSKIMPKMQKHLWPTPFLWILILRPWIWCDLRAQYTHSPCLSGSADEASCICEYQLWQLLVFAHTLVLVPSHLTLPTWLRSTQTPSKKWHECVHNTDYITVYMDWAGDVVQIDVKLTVMAQMYITVSTTTLHIQCYYINVVKM